MRDVLEKTDKTEGSSFETAPEMDVETTDSESVPLSSKWTKEKEKKKLKDRKRKNNDSDEFKSPLPATSDSKARKNKKKKKSLSQLILTEHESDSEVPKAHKSDPETTLSLKARSEKIFRSAMAFMHDPDNDVDSKTTEVILGKLYKLQGVLNEALIQNSHLEGQVAALKGETAQQRRTFGTTVEKAGKGIAAASTTAPSGPLTYAERVGLRSTTAMASNLKRDPPNVITILPKDTKAFVSSEATKETVQKLISPARDGLQVVGVRGIQGNGILAQTAKKSDVTALLGNQKLRAAGLVVGAPQKKSLRVILYNTPRMLTDETLFDTIIEQNVDQEERTRMRQQMRVAFKSGDKNKKTCNTILEVSNEARNYLLKRESLHIGWSRCNAQDYIAAKPSDTHRSTAEPKRRRVDTVGPRDTASKTAQTKAPWQYARTARGWGRATTTL